MSNGVKWDFKPINELCIFAIDCVNKTAPVVGYKTPYKMIRTTNVKNGFIDLDTVRYVEKDIFDKWTRRSKPKYGDVILTREAPVGSVGRFVSKDNNVFLGQRLFHYRPNPELLDWNFLAYFLQSEAMQSKLNGMSFGATVDHITVEDAETLKIACPHISIQKKIGNILSNYDNLIENNNTRIKLLENMAEELYKEWFVRLRFPNYQNTKIVDGIPEGWEYNKLPIISTITDGTHESPKESLEKNTHFLITGKHLVNNQIDFNSAYKISKEEHLKIIQRSGLNKGDILFSNIGTIGNIALISNFYDFSCKNVFIFKPNKNCQAFLYQFLKLPHTKELLLLQSNGATQKFISLDYIRNFKILIPTIKYLEKFENLINPILDNINTLQLKNQNLKKTRDLLLPRLISGKLDIKDMDIV
jgi:type I restriction enzyme, S subunit